MLKETKEKSRTRNEMAPTDATRTDTEDLTDLATSLPEGIVKPLAQKEYPKRSAAIA